jgi:hypothetical protein
MRRANFHLLSKIRQDEVGGDAKKSCDDEVPHFKYVSYHINVYQHEMHA